MKQITEDYVSFETAKLLKDKGFDLYEVREWVAKPQDKSTLERDSFPTLENFMEDVIVMTFTMLFSTWGVKEECENYHTRF